MISIVRDAEVARAAQLVAETRAYGVLDPQFTPAHRRAVERALTDLLRRNHPAAELLLAAYLGRVVPFPATGGHNPLWYRWVRASFRHCAVDFDDWPAVADRTDLWYSSAPEAYAALAEAYADLTDARRARLLSAPGIRPAAAGAPGTTKGDDPWR